MSSTASRPPRCATCARTARGAHTSECGRPVGACRSVASLARLCRATPVARLSDSGREDSPILPVTRWRASARRAHGGPRWRPRTRHLCCFDFEEAFFRLEAPSKACERTVFADHAMAWSHNGDRILSVCRANRSEGARLADCIGDLAVGSCLSKRNVEQLRPDLLLKRRSGEVERKIK